MTVEAPEATNEGQAFDDGENPYEELAEQTAEASPIEQKLAQAGLDRFITKADLADMQGSALRLEAVVADEDLRDKPTDTAEYRAAFFARKAFANIAEGKPAMDGIVAARDQEAVDKADPYGQMAASKLGEFSAPRGDGDVLSPEAEYHRQLRVSSGESPDLARAELEMVKIAQAREKILAVGAAEKGEAFSTGNLEEYASTVAAYEAYANGDRNAVIKLASGQETTASELMKAHIASTRRQEAEAHKARQDSSPESSSESETSAGVEPVPKDEAGYKAYEKKYFSEFNPKDIHEAELQEYV
ncbi:MAG TPA: hypothetical protein VMR98_02430, partial [Candidatus Polarisedimenticolaceae bacterium]|nr:hypothetical protein [Candidatus Polarisedimenticolaceae bacterium]